MIIGVWAVENSTMESTFVTTKMLIMDWIHIMIMQVVNNTQGHQIPHRANNSSCVLILVIRSLFCCVTIIFYTVDVNDNHSEQNQQKKWNGREILQYHNHNLSDVVTPVKADLLASMLQESNYDQQEIEFLHNGFTKGFDTCYEGPQDRQSRSENIPFTVGDEVDLWNKLMKEVKLK